MNYEAFKNICLFALLEGTYMPWCRDQMTMGGGSILPHRSGGSDSDHQDYQKTPFPAEQNNGTLI